MAKQGWKLASKSTTPQAVPLSLETRQDTDIDKAYYRKRLDPLSNHLGITNEGFFHNMRWPWFRYDFGGVSYPLEVALYYPSLNLAIDFGEEASETLEAKKKLLKENDIRYARLASPGDFKRLEGI